MSAGEWLAERFEQNRGHLRAVAYRMLGSVSEAEDAVQEAWLRLSRTDSDTIENLGGWLTTVVSRVCLDVLRSRKVRRERSMGEEAGEVEARREDGGDPESEAVLADSVGLALLVVLDRLAPAERLAFVLHDLFGVSFEEIGGIVGRSAAAARQLASRARRRVQGAHVASEDLRSQRDMVERLLAALRAEDVEGLVELLDPEFVIRVDKSAVPEGAPREVRGARRWAEQAVQFRGGGAKFGVAALVDGAVGVVVAPRGRLFRVLRLRMKEGRIAEIEVVADRERLDGLELAVLSD